MLQVLVALRAFRFYPSRGKRNTFELIFLIIIFSSCNSNIIKEKPLTGITKTDSLSKPDKKNAIVVNNKITNDSKQNNQKPKDSIVVLSFKDLSSAYNYKIVDKFISTNVHNKADSVFRVIKILNKKDSLIQIIYPNLEMVPWYFLEIDWPLRLSRSYITKKNANYSDIDNYCGEIVVADLNFDGLEDFATPINSGCDNGPHYAFYIQNSNRRFEYNSYLSNNVTWFPETINDSLFTFTSSVPCTMRGIWNQTFKFDTSSRKWKKIENYVIDITTGKIMK